MAERMGFGRPFTASEVENLKMLVGLGHASPAIARALGRHPQVVRNKCRDLRIPLRPQRKTLEARCQLDSETLDGLKAAAGRYGFATVAPLCRQLLKVVVRDDLFEAVLDPAPQMRTKTVVLQIVGASPVLQRRLVAARDDAPGDSSAYSPSDDPAHPRNRRTPALGE
jgi:hypothetical protein